MERVFHEGFPVGGPPESLAIGLVAGEDQLGQDPAGPQVGLQPAAPQLGVLERDGGALPPHGWPDSVALARATPAPGVAEPELRQQRERGDLPRAIVRRDADQDVVGRGLGVFDEHVEILVPVEDAGVGQLILRLGTRAAAILVEQLPVGKFPLRILVERLHVAVRGRRVEVVVALLDVLAVVALGTRQAIEAFFQDGVPAVPQRQGEAQPSLAVAQAEQSILAPAVDARARVVVREVAPRVALGAVILAHRRPLALGQVGTPALPVVGALAFLLQSQLLSSTG